MHSLPPVDRLYLRMGNIRIAQPRIKKVLCPRRRPDYKNLLELERNYWWYSDVFWSMSESDSRGILVGQPYYRVSILRKSSAMWTLMARMTSEMTVQIQRRPQLLRLRSGSLQQRCLTQSRPLTGFDSSMRYCALHLLCW